MVHQAKASQFNTTPQAISKIVQLRQNLEKLKIFPVKRKNKDPNDTLKVIHFMNK